MATHEDLRARARRRDGHECHEYLDIDTLLDEALAMTFPASDPIAVCVERVLCEQAHGEAVRHER